MIVAPLACFLSRFEVVVLGTVAALGLLLADDGPLERGVEQSFGQ